MKIETGVMVMKDGKAWGIDYRDSHTTSYGWIAPENAELHNPAFVKRPEDLLYAGHPAIERLRTGKLVHVERRTEVIVIGE